MIPLVYNVRSLWVRRVGTAMTVLGIGLTVAIVVVMLSMIQGLDRTFTETGDPRHLIAIRQGSLNEVNSFFGRDRLEAVRALDGVERDPHGVPLVVGEIVVVVNHPRKGGDEANILIRGTSAEGVALRPELRVVEGRLFRDGLREIVVSRRLADRFAGLGIGSVLNWNVADWRVVGLFEAGGGAWDSEIWAGYQDVADVWQRPVHSSILLRAQSVEAAVELAARITDDRRIQLDAFSQPDYFAAQTSSSAGLKALTSFIALIMGIGSAFAIMNMMYGAVMARRQEVATLRALGFSRGSLLLSFLVESALLGLVGGVVGGLLGILFNGYSTGTSNMTTFSEVIFHFRVTPTILLAGLLFALVMGVVGGFLPARRAATVRLVDVLRG